jgi:hypothetical protein
MTTSELPAVLVIAEVATVLRTSVRTVRRQLRAGTFPIPPMTTPIHQMGFDRKYRWSRVDVEHYLANWRSQSRASVRVRRIA